MRHRFISNLRSIAMVWLVALPSVSIMVLHLSGCSSKDQFTDFVDAKTRLSVSETTLATVLKEQLGDSWAADLQRTKQWRQAVARKDFGNPVNPTTTVVAGNDSTVYFYRDITNRSDGMDAEGSQESAIADAARCFGPVNEDCRAVFCEKPFKWGIVAHAKGKHILPADDPANRITVVFRERPDSEKSYGQTGVNESWLSDDRTYLNNNHPWGVQKNPVHSKK